MCPDISEEEMRRALFGPAGAVSSPAPAEEQDETLASAPSPRKPVAKRKASGSAGTNVEVTLRVGNEFEGKTELFIYVAHTLSTLQAELDATKAARKKFRYIELVSVKPAR